MLPNLLLMDAHSVMNPFQLRRWHSLIPTSDASDTCCVAGISANGVYVKYNNALLKNSCALFFAYLHQYPQR
jgi:hypothetical protein